jgi:hypothetical protein
MICFRIFFVTFAILVAGFAYGATQDLIIRTNVYSLRSVYIKWAVPEGRVGLAGTNWDTLYYLTVKDPSDNSILFSTTTLSQTDIEGKDLTAIPVPNVGSGAYNFYIKGHQSLTKKLSNISLLSGLSQLNFTQADNSATLGSLLLLAGDISGSTSSPSTMGDDVINAVDLSIMLNSLDDDDPTTRGLRPNLNQDPVVNSVDMSLLLNNLDKEGDI